MLSAKQHNLLCLNIDELNKIITYLKENIHVNYYIIYKLIDITNCWFIYFQHSQNSICPINLKFNNVYTLLYRGPSKNLVKFIKTNGTNITEYGTCDNLNLKSSLKRELTNIEFTNPVDIKNKTINYINLLKKSKNNNSDINIINQQIQHNNINLETPETDIELTDNEYNKHKLNSKEIKNKSHVKIQFINKNDINIENWKENICVNYKELLVIWIYGISDVDKTDKIKKFIKDNKEKYGTLINVIYYDGKYYKGVGEKAKIAIYDNFKESHMSVFEFLNLIDNEIHDIPTLIGNVKNNYNLIIISSIFNPEYIYVNYNEDIKNQIKKSINKVIKV